MSTAYLTQPRTPDGRFDRTFAPAGPSVMLDLSDEEQLDYVLCTIRQAAWKKTAGHSYVHDRADFVNEFESNTFAFVFERAKAARPDHPTIASGELNRIINGSWARHLHHMRTNSLHTDVSKGNSHVIRAYTAYVRAVDEAERDGRSLSEREREAIARKQARMHGTSQDIRGSVTVRPLPDETAEDRRLECAGSVPSAEDEYDRRQAAAWDERFDTDVAAGDKRGLAEVYWNAYFPGAVACQSISRRRATGIRRAVAADPGGVLAVADRWESGFDDEATEALFAPFNGRTMSDREKTDVVSFLRRSPALADQVWQSALMIATKSRLSS